MIRRRERVYSSSTAIDILLMPCDEEMRSKRSPHLARRYTVIPGDNRCSLFTLIAAAGIRPFVAGVSASTVLCRQQHSINVVIVGQIFSHSSYSYYILLACRYGSTGIPIVFESVVTLLLPSQAGGLQKPRGFLLSST